MSTRTKRQQIAAFAYDKRGRLLAVGRNSYAKTHTLQARFAKAAGNPDRVFLHAEIDALLKGSRRGKIHRMVVVRYGSSGYLLAKPCAGCAMAIAEWDVKEIEYTTGDNLCTI